MHWSKLFPSAIRNPRKRGKVLTSASSITRPKVTIDGNEAAAYVAHQINEVIAIYPITPSSPMGEWADQWSAELKPNIWGTVPMVVEMQSEGGAAGALHGALQTGSLTTTFTASPGLLLMIPNMFKIARELTATVFHLPPRPASRKPPLPFLHFFDGFRTSHEVAKVEQLTPDDMRAMIEEDLVRAHRARA